MRHLSPQPAGRRRNSLGITLLELLIVVIIVGLLASMALPQYGALMETLQLQKAESNLKAVRTGERYYFLGEGGRTYTATLTDLTMDQSAMLQDDRYDYFVDVGGSTAYVVDEGSGAGATRVREINLNTGVFL